MAQKMIIERSREINYDNELIFKLKTIKPLSKEEYKKVMDAVDLIFKTINPVLDEVYDKYINPVKKETK